MSKIFLAFTYIMCELEILSGIFHLYNTQSLISFLITCILHKWHFICLTLIQFPLYLQFCISDKIILLNWQYIVYTTNTIQIQRLLYRYRTICYKVHIFLCKNYLIAPNKMILISIRWQTKHSNYISTFVKFPQICRKIQIISFQISLSFNRNIFDVYERTLYHRSTI